LKDTSLDGCGLVKQALHYSYDDKGG